MNLIGNGVLALLRNPEQWRALRADPAGVPAAIEEFLRFDGPVDMATVRYTAEPITMGDTEIPEGEIVYVALTAANRDPAASPTRTPSPPTPPPRATSPSATASTSASAHPSPGSKPKSPSPNSYTASPT